MKIRFKVTSTKRRHGSRGIAFRRDGQTRELSREDAEHLLKWWPDNFERVGLSLRDLPSPVHESITLSGITIITICHDPQVLRKSLLPCLPEEAEFIRLDNEGNRNWTSLAQALNHGIRRAKNDIVICAHSDTRFDRTWFGDFIRQECRLKGWGALGIVGMDRGKRLHWGADYNGPKKVDLLDACCIIVNRRNGIWFDEETFRGRHRYDFDFCLQCHEASLGVYVVTGLAYHDCDPDSHPRGWPQEIAADQKLLEAKWRGKFPDLLEAAF